LRREKKILSFFDIICGSRMHVGYLTIGGVVSGITQETSLILYNLNKTILGLFDLLEQFSSHNRVLYLRLRGIGIFNIIDIANNSISGVLARSTGVLYDIRFFSVYETYRLFFFKISISFFGDA